MEMKHAGDVQPKDEDSELLLETGSAGTPPRRAFQSAPHNAVHGLAGLAGLLLLGLAVRLVMLRPSPAQTQLDGTWPVTQLSESIVQCPGSVNVPGLDGNNQVQVVNSKVGHLGVDAGQMHVEGDAVVMHMEGRAYLADQCTEGSYSNQDYTSISLLGKTVQFTVDLGGAGCGCNVAFYFVSMKQNSDETKCKDYYCDANSVCGVPCSEVDIMEANSLVWRSTLHLQEDPAGSAAGYGGTGPHTQTWTSKEYGPGSTCIDTNKPFNVQAHFPVHDGGTFQGMMVDLQQDGSLCGGLTASVGWYEFGGADALAKLTDILKEGMVPVVSYWKSDDMLWLDGSDVNGETPCEADRPLDCPLIGPRILNFQVSDFKDFIHKSTMELKPTQAPVYRGGSYGADADVAQKVAAQTAGQGGVPDEFAAAGWTVVHDEGQVYYYNTLTQQTAWNLQA
jgi:hypothetical protein